MNNKRIEELLEKYWLCETTIPEEEELRSYFHQPDIPEHLLKYKALFTYRQEEAEVALDDNFDERILKMISPKKKEPVRRIIRPYLRVAASIIVVLGFVFSAWLYNQQTNPWKQDTYETPEQALAEVQRILTEVTGQMEKGTELVSHKMGEAESIIQIIRQ